MPPSARRDALAPDTAAKPPAWSLHLVLPGSSSGLPGLRKKPLPYFGMGWATHWGSGRRLVFSDDAGMMFEGRPLFVASGRCGPTPLPDDVMQRLEAAAARGHLRWQPVVTASLAYQF